MFNKSIVNNAGGTIALLFRRIINNNNLKVVLTTLIKTHVDKKFSTTADRTAETTNYEATLNKGEMTMNKFVEYFKDLFKVKYMSFTVVAVYEGKEYKSNVVLNLKEKNDDVVYLLFNGLLESGLKDYLKDCIAKNIVDISNSEKKKYVTINKIKNTKMTWKIFIWLCSSIFRVSKVTISCKLEFGKKTMIEELASITF